MTQRSIYLAGSLLLLAAQGCSGGAGSDDYAEDNVDSSSQDLAVEDAANTASEKALLPRPVPIPDPDAPMCGGIAAFRCPGAGRCVDNPYDDCDPQHGGADCSGLCVCLAPRPGPVITD